jgi:hypothetical protein
MPSNKVHNLKQVESTPADPNAEKLEPLNEELANGPLAQRKCTDVLCCLLFVVFMGGMIGIAGYAISKGNPNLIGRGYDSDGKMCGVDAGYEDYPYLYFPIPFPGYLTTTVCLKTCPTSLTASALTSLDCHKTGKYNAPCAKTSSTMIFTSGGSFTGQFYIYETTAYVERLCIPTKAVTQASTATSALFSSDLLEQWVSDIRTTWPVIAASIGIAFVIGFIYMIFLRYCSGVLTWLAIIAFIAGTGVLGWRFYQKAKTTETDLDATSGQTSDTNNASESILTLKIVAYVCWGVSGFTLLAVLCLYNRIRLAIAILKAASDFVKDTPSVFILPPLTAVILTIFYAYWGGTAIYLISSGDASQIQNAPFGTFEFDKTLKKLLIYHLFGLLWFNAFVMAATQFVIASTTALWYFSQGTGQNAPKTIRTSIKRLLRYHFGSIAFGSLILAIVQMIRLVLAYIQAQAKKLQGKDGKVVRFVLSCLQCYLACFEKCIKFLNKNAYIQIALSGKSFCGAAKDAFSLIMRNPLRMGVVTSLGGIFVLFGKIFIASLTALAGFLVITNWDKFNQIYSPFIPTIIIFVFAYVVGACFMTVYGLAADTILACFILDEEINSKKNAPPRHCPESLRNFLNNNVKK